MKKEILHCVVLGGNGFIGSHLVPALVREGYSVTVFGHKSKKNCKNVTTPQNHLRYIEGDIKDLIAIRRILKKGCVVFDLITSSVPYSSMCFPVNEVEHNVLSHIQLIEMICKARVAKIVFTSSGGGIYKQNKKIKITEDLPLQPISPHAIGKVTLEHYLDYFCRISNIPYLIYRLSNPYGPKQSAKKGFGVVPTLFSQVIQKKQPILFNKGAIVRDFIYIEDIISAIVQSFHKKTCYNIYNIGSGKGTSLSQLWNIVQKLTNTTLVPIYKQKRLIDLDFVILDTRRFCKEFNWKPNVSLAKGLAKTWQWIKTDTTNKGCPL